MINVSNFISAFVGAFVGGIFVLVGTYIGLRYDSKKEQKKEKELINSFKKAIYYEIYSLWNLPSAKEIINKFQSINIEDKYLSNEIKQVIGIIKEHNNKYPSNPYDPDIQNRMDKLINNILPQGAFLFYFSFTQNYFPVYEQNANLIGLIDDKELTELIVTTYNVIRSLIEYLLINDNILGKFEFYRNQFTENPNLALINVGLLLSSMELLRNNAVTLKSALESADKKINSLLEKLKN
jgi:hypothetical protein